jgi:CRISPR-associated protein Cas2
MFYCLAYDITCNKIRRQVVKWCKQAGLRRMQKSVFAGPVPSQQLAELIQNLESISFLPSDKISLFPLDKNALKGITFLGDASAALHLQPTSNANLFY